MCQTNGMLSVKWDIVRCDLYRRAVWKLQSVYSSPWRLSWWFCSWCTSPGTRRSPHHSVTSSLPGNTVISCRQPICRRSPPPSAGRRPKFAWTSSFTKFDRGSTANRRAASYVGPCDRLLRLPAERRPTPAGKCSETTAGPTNRTGRLPASNSIGSELDSEEFPTRWTPAKHSKPRVHFFSRFFTKAVTIGTRLVGLLS